MDEGESRALYQGALGSPIIIQTTVIEYDAGGEARSGANFICVGSSDGNRSPWHDPGCMGVYIYSRAIENEAQPYPSGAGGCGRERHQWWVLVLKSENVP